MTKNKTVLCIIDGLGYKDTAVGNAIKEAGMPNLKRAMNNNPFSYIKASGKEVGLDSDKDAGNSEVGHNAIGAGVTIKQGLSLLNNAFDTGKIFENNVWAELIKRPKLNIIVLLSNGRVHSDIAHLQKVLGKCKEQNIKTSVIAIADGRDVSPRSVKGFIAEVEGISIVGGRGQIFMDRYESQTELLTRAFEVCVEGNAPFVQDWEKHIDEFYNQNPVLSDEQLPPFILDKDNLIQNGDAVLLLNYRGDRAIETVKMFEQGKYISNQQYDKIKDCYFAGILQYDAEEKLPSNFLCEPPVITNTLTEWLCNKNIRQYTVTETVKFGHMTYFFNGNKSQPIDEKLEKWVEIESDKLNNQYDKAPKMKAEKISDKLVFNLRHGDYSFLKCNFPNPDMVGHTGNFDATVQACKIVDECVGRIYDVCKTDKINLIITADHGNAEEMLDDKGKMKTSHTNNLVPFIVCPFGIDKEVKIKSGEFGLTNIAATVCDLLGIETSTYFNKSIIEY